jgi:KipI family sensor histidine kinase inhibitor
MTAPTIRDYGDRALLLECGSTDEVLVLCESLRQADLPEITDVVPGARTVLVTLADGGTQAALRVRLSTISMPAHKTPGLTQVEVVIDTVYDGVDLAEVAEWLRMDADEVVQAHTATPWRVGFGGFAPGFAYLVGGDPRLIVPRRVEPRTRVPAGSVALGGEFSGIYPRESPGGWQLIGRTAAVLWDIGRPQPALLSPGMVVRFRDAGLP